MRQRWMMFGLMLFWSAATMAASVAFVDAERAVALVDEGRLKIAELDQWAEPRRKEVTDLQGRLGEILGRITRQEAVGSEESLVALRAEQDKVQLQIQVAARSFEHDLQIKQGEFLADVAVKVGAVASEYGREQGLDAIFVLKAQPVIYLSDGADITDTVIRLYNERFPVASGG